MKYILFEASSAENIVTNPYLQSLEYKISQTFIDSLRGVVTTPFSSRGVRSLTTKDGIIFSGKRVEKKFLMFDLEQCSVLSETSDSELLLIVQKVLRFSIRYWGKQNFTSTENIVDDKAVIFPFPYSQKIHIESLLLENLHVKDLQIEE